MNISLTVRFNKNWELENGKVRFNMICLTNTVDHMAPSSRVITRCRCIFVEML